MARLDRFQQRTLQQAEKALAASKADTDHANFSRHLGALEVNLAWMVELVKELSGNA